MSVHGRNINFSPYLTTHYVMKQYNVVEIQLNSFLTSTLDECEWSDSYRGHFNPEEITSDKSVIRV